MQVTHLNLARKWRSNHFGEIVGQDLVVRILKNSLYLNKFFPVYLLAGQHGCGKTTTARVFAAALNCASLPDFQTNPQKTLLPCGTCDSCVAMRAGKHPDFIEIDAASHTGVDNVRQLVEASTLMPLIGRKKIYLVDEAHMLSRAAFNAFLKVLEEPTDFVLFMLATTDEHKIIDTVKSRCFQLFFQAVEQHTLITHLQNVCTQESIICEPAGLELIVKHTHGSVRDALNLLEQVNLSEQKVDKRTVSRVIGSVTDDVVCTIVTGLLIAPSLKEFTQTVASCTLEKYNSEQLWHQLLQVLHAAIQHHFGLIPTEHAELVAQLPLDANSPDRLIKLFQLWCDQEPIFLKTAYKQTFINFFLLQAWQQVATQHINAVQPAPAPVKKVTLSPAVQTAAPTPPLSNKWGQFIQALEQLQEPLLVSVFRQATVSEITENTVTITLAKRLVLFKDTIEQAKPHWQPLFIHVFENAELVYIFVEQENISVPRQYASTPRTQKPGTKQTIDVSDKNRWPLTNQLLEYFPGTVTAVAQAAPTPPPVSPETDQELPHE